MGILLAWTLAAVLMAGIAAWLAIALRMVADSDLPHRVHGRARWWRRWGWTVAGACSVGAVAMSFISVVP
jgi:hypothetical protein